MDNQDSAFAQDSVSRIIESLSQVFGNYTFYDAWPNVWPPKDAWPLMVVQLLNAKPVVGPTQTDEFPEVVEVTIMINQADAAGSAKVRTTRRREIQRIVQGQDPETLQYKDGTVMKVLRTLLTLDQYIINSDCSIKYDIDPPKDLPTMVAAVITLSMWRRVYVPGRT